MRGGPTAHTWLNIKAVIPLATAPLPHLGNTTAGLLGCEGCRRGCHFGACCSEHAGRTCWQMPLCLSSTTPHHGATQGSGENTGARPGARLQLSNPPHLAVTIAGSKEDQGHAICLFGETRKETLASTAGTGLMTEAKAAWGVWPAGTLTGCTEREV